MKKIPIITFLLILLCAIGQFLQLLPELAFNSAMISSGQYWRFISGHLVHLDAEHLIWNLLPLLLLGTILENYSRFIYLLSTFFSMAAISIYLMYEASGSYYCGYSAVLNSYFYIALAILWQKFEGQKTAQSVCLITAIAGLLKLTIEAASGEALLSQLYWPPHMVAHGVGAAVGCCGGVFIWLNNKRRRAGFGMAAQLN